jgi:adenylate cyclase
MAVNLEQVGKELGVRYAVEGSVRRAGDRVRVVAQLIDATTGFHLWSGRYDRELSDIFAIQSEIAEEMLRALQVEIQEAEIERVRRKPTVSLTAYEAWVKGRAQHWSYSAKDTAEARRLFERATLLDPGYAEAYAQLGNTYITDFWQGWSPDAGLLERAEALARRALELDPLSPEGHITLAASLHPRGDSAEQVSAAERGVELAPNLDAANALLGLIRLRQGRFDDAARLIELAIRLNPRAPDLYWTILGHVHRRSGRIEEAVALWERARAADPDGSAPRTALAHHYQSVGRLEDANALVAEILGVHPAYTAKLAAQLLSQAGQADPEATAEIAEQLRKAGLP